MIILCSQFQHRGTVPPTPMCSYSNPSHGRPSGCDRKALKNEQMGRVGGRRNMGMKIPTVLDMNIVEQGVKIFTVVTLSQQIDTH